VLFFIGPQYTTDVAGLGKRLVIFKAVARVPYWVQTVIASPSPDGNAEHLAVERSERNRSARFRSLPRIRSIAGCRKGDVPDLRSLADPDHTHGVLELRRLVTTYPHSLIVLDLLDCPQLAQQILFAKGLASDPGLSVCRDVNDDLVGRLLRNTSKIDRSEPLDLFRPFRDLLLKILNPLLELLLTRFGRSANRNQRNKEDGGS